MQGARVNSPSRSVSQGRDWASRAVGPHIHLPRFRDACSMRRSGTALSFLLSEVSGGGWPIQGIGEASQHPPTQKHPELPGDPLTSGETEAQRGHYKTRAQSRCPAQSGLQPLLWGVRDQQRRVSRDYSYLDARFWIAQGKEAAPLGRGL